MKKILILIFIILTEVSASFGQTIPEMRYEDKIRIREAINISNLVGDKIWAGINEVPFVLILVTDSIEYLINHPYPSDDFKLSENDSLLNSKIFYRPRQFPVSFLATFPAVNGVNCIVAGTPENTNKKSTDWTVTLLHEHFHQFQFTYHDYYKSVDNLELSGGDQTGMWQLNYAFPYDSGIIIDQYKKYTASLFNAVSGIGKKNFTKEYKKYTAERNNFKKLLKPSDYRYFSFQIWQEGIARYTEYKFLELLDNYQPSIEMRMLTDYISFIKFKDAFIQNEINNLLNLKLDTDKRVCFYAIGFSEGLLLDKLNPDWHDSYLIDKFYIENYFKTKTLNR